MIRPLALIGTVAMMAAGSSAHAQQPPDCQSCDPSVGICATGVCDAGDWQYANCETGDCNNSGGTSSLCSTKGFPDKGWNPPARLPVNRDGIWYRNYWPQAWYGNPGGAFISNSPMVYQPTDTTQLGYAYAKVPTWQARRMIPPTPCPSHFHARVCVPRESEGCPTGNPCDAGACPTCPSCPNEYAMSATSDFPTLGQPVAPAQFTVPQPVAAAPVLSTLPLRADQAAIGAVPVRGRMTKMAAYHTRPPAANKKRGVFQLAGWKSLFE